LPRDEFPFGRLGLSETSHRAEKLVCRVICHALRAERP
jgi:hypothetical protein